MRRITSPVKDNEIVTLAWLFDYAEKHYADMPASEFLDADQKYTYGQLCAKSRELDSLMLLSGIGADEKIVIYSQNMPNWTVAYFSAVAFGRVVVPILAESSTTEVDNIINHSEASTLFVSRQKFAGISDDAKAKLNLIVILDNFEVVKNEPKGEGASCRVPAPDDLAGIFYTSGTTGTPKGVMLTHANFCQNVIAAMHTFKSWNGCKWLSILPMAHTYEMAFSLLYPFQAGGTVYYLPKAPTVSVLTKALARVKPNVVCSVPLIMEKVYKGTVRKTIEKSKTLRWMEKHTKTLLYRIIGNKLKTFFGGELVFFGIGGAKLDPIVEDFMIRADFPYAIGYGLTETAPLICSTQVGKGKCGSIGWHSINIDVRLGDVDPQTGEGEIQCKGPNVMKGYYKDPERTASVFTEDGWFRTGDLATVDKKGYYFIKGRIGSMIVGASGENIYPEEIEQIINSIEEVVESLVIRRDNKLVALVKLEESADSASAYIEEKSKAIIDFVNSKVRSSNKVNEVEIVKESFIKTATLKIKRFLYK